MLEDAFTEYVSGYDMNNLDIKLKYNHSFRVMKLQEKYAKLLGFSEEDVELAKAIGLLHDIGRFEQLRVYNTYSDIDSIDHADYSCEQLFDKGLIEKFNLKKEWYPIIKHAVKNHNKNVLEEVDDERTMMHSKLIRDTDKIDIIYLFGCLDEKKTKPSRAKISKRVYDSFMRHENVSRKYERNMNDTYVVRYSFIFNVYNDICLKELMKYYECYHERLKGHEGLEEIYKEFKKYCKERLKNGRIRKEV